MIALQELEALFGILSRAPVSQIEAWFLNALMGKLRALVAAQESPESEANGEKSAI